MKNSYSYYAEQFKALSDDTRLEIFLCYRQTKSYAAVKF